MRAARPWLAAAVVVLSLRPFAADAGAPRLDDLAKDHFGRVTTPAVLPPRAVGSYARGCVTGAVALPPDGPSWQAMRLSRNRNWGHPMLVEFVQDLAAAAPELGLGGILVGDLSQPRGGPMPYGHASHQSGLDVGHLAAPRCPARTPRRARSARRTEFGRGHSTRRRTPPTGAL